MIGANIQRLHQGIAPGASIANGGGGSSSSSSSSNTTTTNVDRRQVVDAGGFGFAGDSVYFSPTDNTRYTDGRAYTDESSYSYVDNSIKSDSSIVNKALDTVAGADAVNGEGFNKLLTLADKLFTEGGNILETTANTTMAQVAALNTAQNDAKGAIDQKTIVLIVIGGVVAFSALKGK